MQKTLLTLIQQRRFEFCSVAIRILFVRFFCSQIHSVWSTPSDKANIWPFVELFLRIFISDTKKNIFYSSNTYYLEGRCTKLIKKKTTKATIRLHFYESQFHWQSNQIVICLLCYLAMNSILQINIHSYLFGKAIKNECKDRNDSMIFILGNSLVKLFATHGYTHVCTY